MSYFLRNRTKFASACLTGLTSLISIVSPGEAYAETKTYSASSAIAVGSWTTCPSVAAYDGQLCNYTAVFSAQGSQFSKFLILQLANFRVYTNGTALIAAAAAGYAQPAPTVNIDGLNLTGGSAAASVYLYGNCGNPDNISTCSYYGVGSISSRWTGTGNKTTWTDSKTISENGIKYVYRLNGATRSASLTGSASFNSSTWALGRKLSGQLTKTAATATVTCPAGCPSALAMPSLEALEKAIPNAPSSSQPDPDAVKNKPLNMLENSSHSNTGEESAISPHQADRELGFDFSPLGQVNAIFRSTGYYGGTLSGLGGWVDQLLQSYANSGRRFGFYPQAYNNSAYWTASNYNSGNVFRRDLVPYGIFGF